MYLKIKKEVIKKNFSLNHLSENMKNIKVTNLGQIKEADINFSDFTLFVGPQATGKSILLQSIKLFLDSINIFADSNKYGYDLFANIPAFFEFYFGEGMNNIWNENTQIQIDKIYISIKEFFDVPHNLIDFPPYKYESLFSFYENLCFIPAQRVMTIANGWPRPFSSFDIGEPYVVRNFSDQLRLIIQKNFSRISKNDNIFPNTQHFFSDLYEEIDKSIFHGASVGIKVSEMRKQLYIDIGGNFLPFMTWSTGQREFIPLLLIFDWLINNKQTENNKQIGYQLNLFESIKTEEKKYFFKDNKKWVVIEEPEMGLHPQAILSVILMCLELINQGYKLIISTHSPVLLEAVWVIRFLQTENPDVKYLYQLFNLEPSSSMTALFENILKNKTFSTYYFDQQKDGVYVKDISSLDPGDLDDAIADWGGLTSFSSRASEVVSQAVQEKA